MGEDKDNTQASRLQYWGALAVSSAISLGSVVQASKQDVRNLCMRSLMDFSFLPSCDEILTTLNAVNYLAFYSGRWSYLPGQLLNCSSGNQYVDRHGVHLGRCTQDFSFTQTRVTLRFCQSRFVGGWHWNIVSPNGLGSGECWHRK